jgi:hypothetical protein
MTSEGAPMLVHGIADDGTVAEVRLPQDGAHLARELADRWPPLGLRREDVTGVEGEAEDEAGDAGDADEPAPAPATRLRLTSDTDGGWDRLESDLALFAAERLTGRVAVHAALAVVDGTAIVVPGRSFTGKTTLGLALARAGAVLASDEYALVDPVTGLVTGWPRPARIRLDGGGSRREPVAATIDPTPVALVALLRYDATRDEDVDPVELEPLTRADGVVRILDETVCARSRPEASLDAALLLTEREVIAGPRGDADATAAWLVARLRATTTAAAR